MELLLLETKHLYNGFNFIVKPANEVSKTSKYIIICVYQKYKVRNFMKMFIQTEQELENVNWIV